jgi:hypothetical protein
MSKSGNNYTPAQMRSISMNPTNKAFYGSRGLATPASVPGETRVDQQAAPSKPASSE